MTRLLSILLLPCISGAETFTPRITQLSPNPGSRGSVPVVLDIDGDGQNECVSLTGYLRPRPTGPSSSPSYNFIGGYYDDHRSSITAASDFDGDRDAPCGYFRIRAIHDLD